MSGFGIGNAFSDDDGFYAATYLVYPRGKVYIGLRSLAYQDADKAKLLAAKYMTNGKMGRLIRAWYLYL